MAEADREVLDVVGCYAVAINSMTCETVSVMDIELYNEAVVSVQYIDRNGRTVLWRRFNRNDWSWSALAPAYGASVCRITNAST